MIPRTKARQRVRMVISLTYQPSAECIANIEPDESKPERQCPWKHDRSSTAAKAARDHTLATGHVTQVTQEKVTEYERVEER